MSERLKTPLIVVAVIAVAALVAFLGTRAMSAGNLDQGQVKYTPGVPPWQEKGVEQPQSGAAPNMQPAIGN